MADQVDVPGVGPLNKTWVIGGTSAAGAYVVYRWWRARSAASAAPVPVAGDASAVPAPGAAGSAGAGGAYVNPAPGAGGGASYNAGTATGTAPTTNQAWTAAVVQNLGNLGYNPQTVAEALAAYLAQQPLTDAQTTIIRLAWSFEGRPPGNPSLNITSGGATPTPAPTGPKVAGSDVTINVGHNTPVQEVINRANALGYKMQWSDFWAWNPNLPANDLQQVDGTWTLTAWSTTVTIQKAGSVVDAELGGDYNPNVPHAPMPTLALPTY